MRALALTGLCLVAATASAGGLSVADAWHAAQLHDPVLAAAHAQRDAGRARGAEGRALWLPTLSALGSAGHDSLDSRTQGAFFAAPGFGSTSGVDFRTSVTGGTATRWALTAEQPLFDAGRLAESRAQKYSSLMAEKQYQAAEQDLMMRSTRAYFDVLNARAQMQSLMRLRTAAERARAEALARYEAGDIPVTDMREAQANADAIDVQALDARSAVTLSEAAFTDLTGLDAEPLGELAESMTTELPAFGPLDAWLQRAQTGSPRLAIQQLAVNTATAQANRYDALNSPRVSLVAAVGQDSLHGDGDFGSSRIDGRKAGVGIQVSMPLFTGGMRTAQRHEAKALQWESEAQLDGAGLQVRQQARAAWLAVGTAGARVQALRRLRASTLSRRDATQLGAEIGGRSVLELLNAEADYQRSGADLHRAQSDWLLAALQLKAIAGELKEEDLRQVEHWMAAAPSGPK